MTPAEEGDVPVRQFLQLDEFPPLALLLPLVQEALDGRPGQADCGGEGEGLTGGS